MQEITIDAIKVQKGQTVSRVVTNELSRWRKHPRTVDQDIRKTKGHWPTVVDADYWERGEGGQPTVYLSLSDRPGWTFCLAPEDQVTVEVA